MAKYILLALNGPVPGEGNEATYNRWYDEIHVPDLLAIPGVVSARRFKVVQSNLSFPYVATYEIETDDIAETLKAIATGTRPFDPTFQRDGSAHVLAVALGE